MMCSSNDMRWRSPATQRRVQNANVSTGNNQDHSSSQLAVATHVVICGSCYYCSRCVGECIRPQQRLTAVTTANGSYSLRQRKCYSCTKPQTPHCT
jgi:hypothetical protein